MHILITPLILTQLFQHVAALPQASATPDHLSDGLTGPKLSECSRKTIHGFAWTVTDFEYATSYLAMSPHEPGVDSATVNFKLFNPATEVTSECSASTSSFANSTATFRCSQEGGKSTTRARFSFTPTALRIWGEWRCVERSPSGGSARYYGEGNVSLAELDLTCTASSSIIDPGSWQPGDIYEDRQTSCKGAEFTIEPASIRVVP